MKKNVYHFKLGHNDYIPLEFSPALSSKELFKDRILSIDGEENESIGDFDSCLLSLERHNNYEISAYSDFFSTPNLNEVFILAATPKMANVRYNEWLESTKEYWHDAAKEYERAR